MAGTSRRFTIYDMMEARGDFEANPANRSSPNFDPRAAKYPKMFYHPKGDQRMIDPGTVEVTPFGPQKRGEKWEIIWAIASNGEEEEALRGKGWHDHPARAIASRGDGTPIPEISSAEHISDLQRQLEATKKLLAEAQAGRALASGKGKGAGAGPLTD